jgi:hypothetical protein
MPVTRDKSCGFPRIRTVRNVCRACPRYPSPQESEQVSLPAPSSPLGGAVLPVDHCKAGEAEESAGQARPEPRRRSTSEQEGNRCGEPRDGAHADYRTRVSEAAWQWWWRRRHKAGYRVLTVDNEQRLA